MIADRLFGAGPKLDALAQNYSLVLSNSHFSINEVRPLVPALVEVGGLHLDNTQTLSKVRYLLINDLTSTKDFTYYPKVNSQIIRHKFCKLLNTTIPQF